MNEPTTLAPSTLGVSMAFPASQGLEVIASPAGVAPAQISYTEASLQYPDKFPVVLSAAQQSAVAERIDAFDFFKLATRDIPTMGLPAELELGKALDAFLARINQQGSPALFRLTDELTNRFEEAKLVEVADRILKAKPSLLARIAGVFNKKYARSTLSKVWEDVSRLASGRSKTLADHVRAIETQLSTEMSKLGTELQHMDKLKDAYRSGLMSFAIETLVLHNALLKARVQLSEREADLQRDPQAYQDAQDRLQALESRALAVEGGLTKLPADQIIISQLQNAGIATLQELATTMASRFTSIKSELLYIHGAVAVQNVQRLGEQGAALDANLGKVREKLMKDVVQTAATMPGRNRAQQAQQLMAVVEQSRHLQVLTLNAREENSREFQAARDLMAGVRQDLLELGLAVNPGRQATGTF